MLFVVLCFVIIFPAPSLNQVCTDGGRIAGLDVEPRAGFNYQAEYSFIFHEYGEINCYGVVTEWRFWKTDSPGAGASIEITCGDVNFQIWRPIGNGDYMLVGHNKYFKDIEGCVSTYTGSVSFKVPEDEQIPVQPGDFIGWGSHYYNRMIEYETGNTSDPNNPFQCVTKACFNGGDTAVIGMIPGFTTIGCGKTEIIREVAMQAVLKTGPAPMFDNLPGEINVPENTIIGDPIGFITERFFEVQATIQTNAIETDQTIERSHVNVDLEFSLLQPEMHFKITTDNTPQLTTYTGVVELLQKLDFEAQSVHVIPIRVTGLGQFNDSFLTVNVIDINEPHSIRNLPDTTTVNAETAKIGDVIFTVDVFEQDLNPDPIFYAIHSVDILDPPLPIEMEASSGKLLVSQDLYGAKWPARYTVNIIAWDYMHESIETLILDLENIRADPIIENLDETIQVPEDAPTGSDIFQVVAKSRYPNILHYSISRVYPFTMLNKFVIDPTSGWIRTTGTPDFNYADISQRSITIEVKAEDDVGLDLGILTIALTWINESPEFTSELHIVEIPEKCGDENNKCDRKLPWTIPGLFLNVVHRDHGVLPDDGRPIDDTICEILPGFGATNFDVVDCERIQVSYELDVNSNPTLMKINLTILVKDSYGLSETAKVYITVYDINDHIPVFSQPDYYGDVTENTKGGQRILTVSATDDDFGENATILYSLQDIPNTNYHGTTYFQIDPFSGVIYTKQPVDREMLILETGDDLIHFFAIATDQGISPNSRQADVYINIQDVNDVRPGFNCSYNRTQYEPIDPNYRCFYNLDVRSDTFKWHTVLHVKALDATPYNLRYYILNPKEHFAINTTTEPTGEQIGYLHTNISELYVYHKYMMINMAEDQGLPKLKARPPVISRVDTFPPEKHLVDITLRHEISDFEFEEFMVQLAEFLHPWYPRRGTLLGSAWPDRFVITIYALTDDSTFLHENLDKPKHFVHVNDLLKKLRKNIFGDPRDDFRQALSEFEPVLVMPHMPNWWIHTLGGLITSFLLLLIALFLIILGIVLLCNGFHICCFRKKKPEHAWKYDDTYLKDMEYEDGLPDANSVADSGYIYDGVSVNSEMRLRASSLSTIHSQVYPAQPT